MLHESNLREFGYSNCYSCFIWDYRTDSSVRSGIICHCIGEENGRIGKMR